MKWDMNCCCGDTCSEFYCSSGIPHSLRRRDVYILHYEDTLSDCNHENNYVAFTSMEELAVFASMLRGMENRKNVKYTMRIFRADDPKIAWLFDEYGTAVNIDVDAAKREEEERIERFLESLRKQEDGKPDNIIVLIDGSGSMLPAWDEAWKYLQSLKGVGRSLWMFKEPVTVSEKERQGLIFEGKYVALIDLEKLGIDISGGIPDPEEYGITFAGYTPLLAGIKMAIILGRKKYPEGKLEVVVISDNRDSMIVRDEEYREYNDDLVVEEAKEKAKVKLSLLPVGGYLRKYMDKYDEVKVAFGKAMLFLNNI